MDETQIRTNMTIGYEVAKVRKLVDILEESFEQGHNNESYRDRVDFAKFLIDHGVTLKNEVL